MHDLYSLKCPLCDSLIAVIKPAWTCEGTKFYCHECGMLVEIKLCEITFTNTPEKIMKAFAVKTDEMNAPNVMTLYLKKKEQKC